MRDVMEFRALIASALAEHPEWLRDALDAVSNGMARAVKEAELRASLKDRATLAALCLANGRVSGDLRETMLSNIVAAIHPENQCPAEQGFVAQYKAIQEQSA